MLEMGFSKHLVCLIENLYMNQEAAVRVEGETSEWFDVGKGVRQGCILSPYLFNIYAENIMRNFRDDQCRYDDLLDPDHDTYDSQNIGVEISKSLGMQMIMSCCRQRQKVLKR